MPRGDPFATVPAGNEHVPWEGRPSLTPQEYRRKLAHERELFRAGMKRNPRPGEMKHCRMSPDGTVRLWDRNPRDPKRRLVTLWHCREVLLIPAPGPRARGARGPRRRVLRSPRKTRAPGDDGDPELARWRAYWLRRARRRRRLLDAVAP